MPMTLELRTQERILQLEMLEVKGEWLCFNEKQHDLVFKSLGSGHHFLLDFQQAI